MINRTLITFAISFSLLPFGTVQSQQRRGRAAATSRPPATRNNMSTSVASLPNAPETLTNASIIEMVKLGFGESLVIEKIKQSKRNFDTSMNGLRQLKAAQISDTLIAVMMNPSAARATSEMPMPSASVAPTVNRAMPTTSSTMSAAKSANVAVTAPVIVSDQTPGIYLYENDKFTEIYPTTFSGSKAGSFARQMTYGIMKSKQRAKVRGGSANIATANRRPVFYFYFDSAFEGSAGARMAGFSSFGATSPGEFIMIRMERKTNTRETVISEGNDYGSSTGARDKDIRDFSFEKVRNGIFKVTPKTDLEPGEYCFFYAGNVSGLGFAGGKLFDFSVMLSN